MHRKSPAGLLLVLCAACCIASDLPRIVTQENRTPAGQLKQGVLSVALEITSGEWYPEAENGPHIAVYAFAEEGKAPSIPGPLIRVREGTRIHARVRNTLPTPLTVHGFAQRPGTDEPVTLEPGGQHLFDFPAGAPGTYYYWAGPPGTTMGGKTQRWDGKSSQLSGALVVDGGERHSADRVFVIGLWRTWDDPEHFKGLKEFGVINGKSWPHTERLAYRPGEMARWRWINASGAIHPMHMHGSFYRVDALGDGQAERRYAAEMRPMVVTQLLASGSTMETSWTPSEPGHWLFHCHLMAHMEYENSLSALQQHPSGPQNHDHGMTGLVMALDVSGGAAIRPAAYRRARKLTLLIEERRADPLEIALQLLDGRKRAASHGLSGPAIVLRRGEPAEITVINHLSQPTSIHWHGMELESYYDGVPNFSGLGERLTPVIPPGGKFVVRMTPPRAGTFIYHTHWHDMEQLKGGLNGPLLVVEPGDYRPANDQVFLVGRGPAANQPLLINGASEPAAVQWRAGTRYHLRLINIAPNLPVTLSLSSGARTLTWRAIGKDGMELPPAQRVSGPASQLVAVGETYDFEAQVERPGEVKLRAVIAAIPGITSECSAEVSIQIH